MKLRSDKSKNNAFEKMATSFVENGFETHPIDNNEPVDLSQTLLDCIERLKEEQKKTIKLFYFEKACYRDIALSLKLEEKKVKSSIQNGKRNLKICIEEKGEDQ